MASLIVPRIESRKERARRRRLAKGARANRAPAARLSPAVQAMAERMLSLQPAQADFWKEYLLLGNCDPFAGFIPSIGSIPDNANVFSMSPDMGS